MTPYENFFGLHRRGARVRGEGQAFYSIHSLGEKDQSTVAVAVGVGELVTFAQLRKRQAACPLPSVDYANCNNYHSWYIWGVIEVKHDGENLDLGGS